MRENSRTVQFSKNMCQSTWSEKFLEKLEQLATRNPKRKKQNKFKAKITTEMMKLHERVPIDRQVQVFRNVLLVF